MVDTQLAWLRLSCYSCLIFSLQRVFLLFLGFVSIPSYTIVLQTNSALTKHEHEVPAEYSPLAIRTRSAAMATATNCMFFSSLINGKKLMGARDLYIPCRGNHTSQHCQHRVQDLYLFYQYVPSCFSPSGWTNWQTQYLTSSSSLLSTYSIRKRRTLLWNKSIGYSLAKRFSSIGTRRWELRVMWPHGLEMLLSKTWRV